MRFIGPILLFLPALTALSACHGGIDAPSLAPRPVEQQPILDPSPPIEPDSTLDSALSGRLTAILTAADQGNATFDRARRDAEVAVGRATGGAEGSDDWVEAQQALSALDAARAPVQDQMTALEELRADLANAARANRDAIDVAASRIGAIDDAQAQAYQALATRLR
jgi:hypothetical protein